MSMMFSSTARAPMLSRGAATECSPGRKPRENRTPSFQPRRGDRIERRAGTDTSAAPTGLIVCRSHFPGLAPGATFCRRSAAWIAAFVCLCILAARTARANDAPPASQPSSELPWLTSLDAGLAESQKSRRPILVDVGAEWCGWCRKLDVEIKKPDVQAKLATWVLVKLDADKDTAVVRKLAVGPIPALRVLQGSGRIVAAHDGYLDSAKLIKWLDEQYKPATAGSELLAMEPKDPGDAQAMINELTGSEDALVREAAIRLLLRRPDVAAVKAVESFEKGKLTARLAVFELLNEWKAPLDGIDPWSPGTITPQRLDGLKKWAADQKDRRPTTGPTTKPTTGPSSTRPTAAAASSELPPDVLAAANRDISLLLAATSAFEVRALRERIARVGPALLPEVSARLKSAATEQERVRLAGLRYRISASDALAAGWPDGFDQLASSSSETRHRAVDELAGRATAADGALLLELFADADPFVRETSLRVLQSTGGEIAAASIVRLLNDPEPNVRAAVLKQLAEHPAPNTEGNVIAFVQREKDPDLIVHAVRVLRETKTKGAASAVLALLTHESWRVRAEAAESLGKMIENKGGSTAVKQTAMERKADVYAAMIKLLDDPDGFVVSRAVIVLRDAKVPAAVEPLVAAVDRRPELAADVLKAISDGGNAASLKYLRQFCTHANPTIRASAVKALVKSLPGGAGKELVAALKDDVPAVRISAAGAATEAIATLRPDPDEEVQTSGFLGFGSKSERKTRDMEQWLARFRGPTGRPDWTKGLIEPLEAMVAKKPPGATDAEALAAAVPLVALGSDAQALPVLKSAAGSDDAAARRSAGAALPWLPWAQRAELFKQLTTKAGHEELGAYVESISQMPNPLAADVLWDTLALPAAGNDASLAAEVHQSLRRVYLGNRYYDRSEANKPRREALAAAAKGKLAADGAGVTDAQRFVALALLAEQSPADAIAPAEKIASERPAEDPLRVDAFTLLLLARGQSDAAGATATAVAALGAADTPYEVKKVAVRFLAMGVEGLQPVRGSIYLSISSVATDAFVVSGAARGGGDANQPAKPVSIPPPQGLKPEMVRPMLTDTDKPIAACAGYLMCLFKDRAGLDPLVGYWRLNQSDQRARRMVYRAAAALNDDGLTPVLEEAYRSMKNQSYYAREFYWTIRGISGPNILKLRKTIRDEVGMDELQ
jgi:HEAT repeat protein